MNLGIPRSQWDVFFFIARVMGFVNQMVAGLPHDFHFYPFFRPISLDVRPVVPRIALGLLHKGPREVPHRLVGS